MEIVRFPDKVEKWNDGKMKYWNIGKEKKIWKIGILGSVFR
jgi:hypothetical protein